MALTPPETVYPTQDEIGFEPREHGLELAVVSETDCRSPFDVTIEQKRKGLCQPGPEMQCLLGADFCRSSIGIRRLPGNRAHSRIYHRG